MPDFKEMLNDVEKLAHKDLGTMISFRDLLEDIAALLNDIDRNCQQHIRWVDVVFATLLLLNLMTTVAIYNMIR